MPALTHTSVAAMSGLTDEGLLVLHAQTPSPAGRRIDVHHHFAPPAWIAEVKGRPMLQLAMPIEAGSHFTARAPPCFARSSASTQSPR